MHIRLTRAELWLVAVDAIVYPTTSLGIMGDTLGWPFVGTRVRSYSARQWRTRRSRSERQWSPAEVRRSRAASFTCR